MSRPLRSSAYWDNGRLARCAARHTGTTGVSPVAQIGTLVLKSEFECACVMAIASASAASFCGSS